MTRAATKTIRPLGERFQDLAWVLTDVEDRLIIMGPELVAQARARRDEHEAIAKAYRVTKAAWRRHDKATRRHQETLAKRGLGDPRLTGTLRRLLEVRYSLVGELSNLAYALEPDWLNRDAGIPTAVARVRKSLAPEFGPVPDGPTLPGNWRRAKDGLGPESYDERTARKAKKK